MEIAGIPPTNPLDYTGPTVGLVPIKVFKRIPTITDVKYRIGQVAIIGKNPTSGTQGHLYYLSKFNATGQAIWEQLDIGGSGPGIDYIIGDDGTPIPPDATGNLNLLGNSTGMQVTGTLGTNTLDIKDLRNITKYVVDATAGETEYQTIQSAIDAANAAGGNATVYVRHGTFTENLTLYDSVFIFGESEQGTIIVGTHTPPASGAFNIFRVTLQSATNIFNSAVAGTTTIIMEDCTVSATNGYTFNLPNWTGVIECFDIGPQGTNDGFVNNTGGAGVFIYSAGFGNGTGNTMIVSGTTVISAADCGCPLSIQGSASATITNSSFIRTVTTAGTATTAIYNSSISSGATAAISHGSANSLTLSDVTIDSTNDPVIDGTGAGNIEIGSITFLDGSNINGALTLNYTSEFESGTAYLQNISFDRGTNTVDTDGELIIGDTAGNPQIGTLTAGAGIAIANGAGSITISSTGSGLAWVEVTGATQEMAVATSYGANRGAGVTFTLPATAAAGTVMEIVGMQGLWSLAQNATQQVHVGNASTTAGVGGSITATNAHDCLVLRCVTANTTFVVQNMMGNPAIV